MAMDQRRVDMEQLQVDMDQLQVNMDQLKVAIINLKRMGSTFWLAMIEVAQLLAGCRRSL